VDARWDVQGTCKQSSSDTLLDAVTGGGVQSVAVGIIGVCVQVLMNIGDWVDWGGSHKCIPRVGGSCGPWFVSWEQFWVEVGAIGGKDKSQDRWLGYQKLWGVVQLGVVACAVPMCGLVHWTMTGGSARLAGW